VLKVPVCTDAVVRHRYTRQQSMQQSRNRASNVEGAFRLRKPEKLAGKHILLVDDVLTTGATITACADVIVKAPGVRISVATFCMAQ
jgi:predicted amidophosphoribosyltransferase